MSYSVTAAVHTVRPMSDDELTTDYANDLLMSLYPDGQSLIDSDGQEITRDEIIKWLEHMYQNSMFFSEKRKLSAVMNAVFGYELDDPNLVVIADEFTRKGMELPSRELIYLPDIDLADQNYERLNVASCLYSKGALENVMLISVPKDKQAKINSLMNDDIFKDGLNGVVIKDNTPVNELKENYGDLIVPMDISAVANPKVIIFINEEKFSYPSKEYAVKEIKTAKKQLNHFKRLSPLALKDIKKLSQVENSQTKHDLNKIEFNKQQKESLKRQALKGELKFNRSKHDEVAFIQNAIKHHTNVVRSQNKLIRLKQTYQRPSRRRPNDVNAIGHVLKTYYKPDIHIYVDTSGSITDDMYKGSIAAIMQIANKIKAPVRLSTFATRVSQPIIIKKSINLKNLPAVGGGTDFTCVWDDINRNYQKDPANPELNFIITDYGFSPYGSYKADMTKPDIVNSYYIGTRTFSDDERQMVEYYASDFAKSMIDAGDLTIKKHMLV